MSTFRAVVAWFSPEWIALIGGAMAAGGTLLAAFGVWRGAVEQARGSRQLLAQSERIVVKADEIASLSQRAISAVTGGDSFVYLQPLRKGGKVQYFVRQTGTHDPTFDVAVRIEELFPKPNGKYRPFLIFGSAEIPGRTLLRGSGFDWTYPDPTFSDRRTWPLVFVEPPPQGAAARRFRIELAARNGIFIQRLHVWPQNDRWHTMSDRLERAGAGPLTLPT